MGWFHKGDTCVSIPETFSLSQYGTEVELTGLAELGDHVDVYVPRATCHVSSASYHALERLAK